MTTSMGYNVQTWKCKLLFGWHAIDVKQVSRPYERESALAYSGQQAWHVPFERSGLASNVIRQLRWTTLGHVVDLDGYSRALRDQNAMRLTKELNAVKEFFVIPFVEFCWAFVQQNSTNGITKNSLTALSSFVRRIAVKEFFVIPFVEFCWAFVQPKNVVACVSQTDDTI